MKPFIIANWKQYLSIKESAKLFAQLLQLDRDSKMNGVDLIIAPSFVALPVLDAAKTKIKIAAQDCGATLVGAHTGAVSPTDLRILGATHVILGHSERRAEYFETDALIAEKIKAARAAKVTPIVCVGETAAERAAKKTRVVVGAQVRAALSAVKDPSELIFAYEPRWAIGMGTAVAPEDAAQIHAYIKDLANAPVRVCYGGSVSPENIAALLAEKNIDGVLIGGASAKFASLAACIKNAK